MIGIGWIGRVRIGQTARVNLWHGLHRRSSVRSRLIALILLRNMPPGIVGVRHSDGGTDSASVVSVPYYPRRQERR